MATKLKHQGPQQEAPAGGGNNVVALTKCTAEGCGKRAELSNFCNEHYSWFKFGLLTREGMKPSDFDKKYQSYMKHKKSAA
jgi:hypothetical protein